MGCDIHLHTEIKINGKWHCYASPNVGRHYAMFAKMADVRNQGDIEFISEPRGLPDDISEVVKLHHNNWRGDAHSESWLNQKEIKILADWLVEEHKKYPDDKYFYPEKIWGYLFGNSYNELPNGVEDARFVFWFDN